MESFRIVANSVDNDEIALGANHPTLDGFPSVALRVENGIVRAAQWEPGNVHRGAEKLCEFRDYRQIIMLVDRHDWLSAFASEIGVAVGVERSLGLSPPLRAQQIRRLMCELTRIAHHLAFLAPLPGPLSTGWRNDAWQWRGQVLDLFETATGHRVHPMFCQIGGVRADLSSEFVDLVLQRCTQWREVALPKLANEVLLDALAQHYRGVAVLDAKAALGHGASGPVLRASGVDLDLRRDDPALPYPDFEVAVRNEGDAQARVQVLLAELQVSIELVAAACSNLNSSAGEPVAVRLPKVIRVPEGHSYTWTENPTGINGYYLVSRNDRTPWRLKIRSAGFGNASALAAALPKTRISDLPAAVASFFLICGDVDR